MTTINTAADYSQAYRYTQHYKLNSGRSQTANKNCCKTKQIRHLKKRNRKSALMASVLAISVILVIVFAMYMTTDAKETATAQKYYRSITIKQNDTLWSLAETYHLNSEQSITDFIREIKEINHMGPDNIKAGMNLIIPYYVAE